MSVSVTVYKQEENGRKKIESFPLVGSNALQSDWVPAFNTLELNHLLDIQEGFFVEDDFCRELLHELHRFYRWLMQQAPSETDSADRIKRLIDAMHKYSNNRDYSIYIG